MIVIATKMVEMPAHCGKCTEFCQNRPMKLAWCGANRFQIPQNEVPQPGQTRERPNWCPLQRINRPMRVYTVEQLNRIAGAHGIGVARERARSEKTDAIMRAGGLEE